MASSLSKMWKCRGSSMHQWQQTQAYYFDKKKVMHGNVSGDMAQHSVADSDGEHSSSPPIPGKKEVACVDKTSPQVTSEDDAVVSFQTQDTVLLHGALATTTRSQNNHLDDQHAPLLGERVEPEPMGYETGDLNNDTTESTPAAAALNVQQTSSRLEARSLKRKSTARADQYGVPGDPEESASNVRWKRAKLPKAAKDSDEDDEIPSAPLTVGKKQAVAPSSGGVTESDGPSPSPSKPQAQSSKPQTSASQEDVDDAEEAEMADGDDETAAVTSSVETARKRGRPRKSQTVAEDEDGEGEDEQTGDRKHQTTAVTPTSNPTKKRGRPPKVAHVSENVDDLDASATTATVEKKPRKPFRSATAATTPAKKASRQQTATPSATARKRRTPKILLSASNLLPAAKSWMTQNKIEVVDETPSRQTNFVCVVRDKTLPSTLKVLRSLVAGKPVVGDSWINDSRKEGELQDTDDYVHDDLKDIDADPTTRRSLFAQKTVFFTAGAALSYDNWQEVVKLAGEAGAVEVLAGNASKGHDTKPKENVIFFGVDDAADDDAEDLIETHGRVVYDKAAFAQWIINAEIDLNSTDYVLTLPLQEKKGGGKKSKK